MKDAMCCWMSVSVSVCEMRAFACVCVFERGKVAKYWQQILRVSHSSSHYCQLQTANHKSLLTQIINPYICCASQFVYRPSTRAPRVPS